MRTSGIAFGLGMLAQVLLAAVANAQGDDVAEGKALYVDQCAGCHGLIASRSSLPAPPRVALAAPAGIAWTDGPSGWLRRTGGGEVAVSPPYGPTLRGVVGRLAGTVADFLYSTEFRRRLQGVMWNRDTLDLWIADSQRWVPGSMMFYAQPDPEIRRKIIDYLSAAR